jgi:hypothetical protein
MPGHGFDDPLMIHANDGCLTPTGPLGLAAGETGLRLDIWIYQPGGQPDYGAACMAFLLNPAGAVWTMNPAPPNNHIGNRFKVGAAIGMGLLVKRIEATQEIIVEQWNAPINLVDK